MRTQGLWLGLLVGLTPGLSFADDDAPVSALLAEASADLPPGGQAEATEIEIELVGGELAPNKFWVGLDCAPPEEALRTQLGLEPNVGLVIRSVVDDSPAKTAGLLAHDVITQAKVGDAEQKITGIAQFSELIQAAEGKPLALTILRNGKSQSVTVTPAERPGIAVVKHERGEPRRLERRDGHGGGDRPDRRRGHGGPPGSGPGGFSFRMAGPVVVKMGEELAKLPDDMKITITKTGNQPAEIAVTQGDKSWTVKDSEFDKLPPEVRGSLAKFLGMGLLTKLRASAGDMLKHFGGPFGRGMPPWAMQGFHGRRGPDAGKSDGHPRHGHEAHRGRGGRPHHGHREAGCPHCGAKHKGRARQARNHRHHGRFAHMHRGGAPRGGMAMHHHGGPSFGRPGFGGPQGCPQCGGGSGGRVSHHGPGSMRGGDHCPLCQAARHSHGPQPGRGHHPHPGHGGPPQAGSDARLEALLTRLERIVGQHGPGGGRPGGPMMGAGGFGPPRPGTPQEIPGGAPPAAQWRPQREPQPGGNAGPRGGGPSNEDLRDQLRRMQEQQERMARAIRDLSEALERSQQRK